MNTVEFRELVFKLVFKLNLTVYKNNHPTEDINCTDILLPKAEVDL